MIIKDRQKSLRIFIILCVVCGLLQVALAPNLAIANGHVNFMLILTLCTALREGGSRAIWCGFISGLFFDLTSTGPIGLMALLLTICGFVLGNSDHAKISQGWKQALRYFAISAAAVELAYQLVMMAFGGTAGVVDALVFRFLPSVLLDCVAFLPFLALLFRSESSGNSLGGVSGTKPRRGGYNIKGR